MVRVRAGAAAIEAAGEGTAQLIHLIKSEFFIKSRKNYGRIFLEIFDKIHNILIMFA